MTNTEKISQLRNEIEKVIKPLITGNCHLTNLPYHTNIGDALIWNGVSSFISKCGFKVLSETSETTWKSSRVKPNDLIIFDGGGNIGDIWRENMEFFLSVVDKHHSNRIIVMPNSAWYKSLELLNADAQRLAQHPDLHLIARDNYSYELMKTHFSANNVYLAPDMAFYIPDAILAKYRNITPKAISTLYLRRIDKEFVPKTAIEIPNATVSDWPTLTSPSFIDKLYMRLIWKLNIYGQKRIIDIIGKVCVKRRNLNIGAKFIAQYDRIVTTRLHTMILAILIGRPVEYIDNLSGKISAYANTWLSDLDSVKPY